MSWRMIKFDELPIKILGRSVSAMFEGEAEISRSGAISAIWLNTEDGSQICLTGTAKGEHDQDLFANLAASLREHCSCSILDAMTDMALNDHPGNYATEMDMDIRRAS